MDLRGNSITLFYYTITMITGYKLKLMIIKNSAAVKFVDGSWSQTIMNLERVEEIIQRKLYIHSS